MKRSKSLLAEEILYSDVKGDFAVLKKQLQLTETKHWTESTEGATAHGVILSMCGCSRCLEGKCYSHR